MAGYGVLRNCSLPLDIWYQKSVVYATKEGGRVNDRGLLLQVPEKGGDQEPKGSDPEEW